MSLKSKIYEYVKSKYPQIVHKGEIGRLAVNEWGYENENAGRRCRELVEAGKIEAHYKNGQVGYSWKPDNAVTYPKVKAFATDDLNDELRELAKGRPINETKEILQAINSKYDFVKKGIIEKYKNPPC